MSFNPTEIELTNFELNAEAMVKCWPVPKNFHVENLSLWENFMLYKILLSSVNFYCFTDNSSTVMAIVSHSLDLSWLHFIISQVYKQNEIEKNNLFKRNQSL